MDMSSIAAAQQSLKALLAIAKVATSAAVDHQIKDKMIEIQAAILDVQSKLGDAQSDRMDLLGEVGELREKLRAMESAKAALDGYALHELEPGRFLYKARQEAGHTLEHFACPTCYSGGSIGILQCSKNDGLTVWTCAVCRFALSTGKWNGPRGRSRGVLGRIA